MSLDSWLAALDERHLADLTPSQVARALRALSSCYVERRRKLERGGAVDSAGKRAAFALFYAPLHFLVTRQIVRSLPQATGRVGASRVGVSVPAQHLIDLGCGTGSGGAAWALEARATRVTGFDRHPWAIAEANWTYRQLAIDGHAARKDITRVVLRGAPEIAILAAYAINELSEDGRALLLPRLIAAHRSGARVLVIEPIAATIARWWTSWRETFVAEGGRADEWRFPSDLPARQRALAKAAGLDPRELTARTLFLGPAAMADALTRS